MTIKYRRIKFRYSNVFMRKRETHKEKHNREKTISAYCIPVFIFFALLIFRN